MLAEECHCILVNPCVKHCIIVPTTMHGQLCMGNYARTARKHLSKLLYFHTDSKPCILMLPTYPKLDVIRYLHGTHLELGAVWEVSIIKAQHRLRLRVQAA